MGEHLAVPCCGIENMKDPGTMARLVWELCNGQRSNAGREMGEKYSERLTVGLNQAIPAGGGALPIYTSWDSFFCHVAAAACGDIKRRTAGFGLCLNPLW